MEIQLCQTAENENTAEKRWQGLELRRLRVNTTTLQLHRQNSCIPIKVFAHIIMRHQSKTDQETAAKTAAYLQKPFVSLFSNVAANQLYLCRLCVDGVDFESNGGNRSNFNIWTDFFSTLAF